jgi:hypothetical protein
MKARKSVFVLTALALLFGGSYLAGKAGQIAVPERRSIADGADPMPLPYPKPKNAGSANDANSSARPGILLADGADPMPLPYPRRLA